MHAGFTGALLTGIESPHTQQTVLICHWRGEKKKTTKYIFFFCLMDAVLTGMFWQGYFSSFSLIASMVCLLSGFRANTHSKCELNIFIFFIFYQQLFVCHLCMCNRQLLPNLQLVIRFVACHLLREDSNQLFRRGNMMMEQLLNRVGGCK